MIFKTLSLALFVVLTFTSTSDARKQAETWGLLFSVKAEINARMQTLTLPENAPRTVAIRLAAKGASLSLDRIVVTYGNGQRHFEEKPGEDPIRIADGQSGSPIDQRQEAMIVDTVTLYFAPEQASSQDLTIEVWGLKESPTKTKPAKSASDKSRGPEQKTDRKYLEVPVYFGTTRRQEADRIKNDRTLAAFGGEDGQALKFGRAVITVPIERKLGSIPRPPEVDLIIKRISFRKEDPVRDFTIASVDVMPRDVFITEMRKQVELSEHYKGQAFVFVHGYNVSFDDAIFRTAQIAQDLEFDGPAISFSWPSQGQMLGYRHDLDAVKSARDKLRQFLELIANETGVTAVNLVAHSMGNDPVIEILKEEADIIARQGKPANFKLNEIVLAAPDINRTLFEEFAEQFAGMAKGGVTLYASKRDMALRFSNELAGGLVRAGYISEHGIVVARGVESIDISDANTSIFNTNHSTFADRAHLVYDMKALFAKSIHPPDVRAPVVYRQERGPNKVWWRYVPN